VCLAKPSLHLTKFTIKATYFYNHVHPCTRRSAHLSHSTSLPSPAQFCTFITQHMAHLAKHQPRYKPVQSPRLMRMGYSHSITWTAHSYCSPYEDALRECSLEWALTLILLYAPYHGFSCEVAAPWPTTYPFITRPKSTLLTVGLHNVMFHSPCV